MSDTQQTPAPTQGGKRLAKEGTAPKDSSPKDSAQLTGLSGNLFACLQTLVYALLALILLFTFLGRIITVIGPSMEPTLQNGEVLLLQHLGYTPKNGDIVVLTKDFAEVKDPYVKRVIATGGQPLEIDYNSGLIYVDGLPLDEPYIKEAMVALPYPRDTHFVVVPEGTVFVMGDNRNISNDSRHVELGAVDERYILGKAFFVLFPFHSFGGIKP